MENTKREMNVTTVYGIAVIATMIICMAMVIVSGIIAIKGMNSNSTITIDAETVNVYLVDAETVSFSEAE